MHPFQYGMAFGFVALCFVWFKNSYFTVEEGYIAVITTFGEVEFQNRELRLVKICKPGLNRKFPWQKVHVVSAMEQIIDLSGAEGGKTAMAEDGTVLRLDSKLRFQVINTELYDYLFKLKNPIEHIKGLFTCMLRNEIASFKDETPNKEVSKMSSQYENLFQTGSFAVIRRERKRLNERIEKFCRDKISRHYGVKFDAVDLTDILPPDELAEALNAVINAQTDAEIRLARTQAECQQKVLSAEKSLEIAKEQAGAAEIEIKTISKYLEKLHQDNVLDFYVSRRKAEVYSEARSFFVKGKETNV